MASPGPTVFHDRFELHRKLARGGMSDVYLARDQVLDRPVAVKVLFPEYARDATFVERFRREAQAAANLNHPNVVAVYDWGRQGGTYFIVMEYVEGRSLSEIIRTEGPLHPTRAAEIAADVAAALGFAHRNGVVHRDIKPGNVLVGPGGQVKVADFGIAQATSRAETTLTQAGSVMGTATYFSPEQAQGKQVDPRSDLYSLGCVLYEMVTTRPPFTGDTPVAIAYKHVQEQPMPPSSLDIDVPAPLEAIIMRLIQKEPGDRYPSAEDTRADLRRFLEGQPVEAMTALPAAATVAAGGAVAGAAAGTVAAALTPDPTGADALPPSEPTDLPPADDDRPRRTGWFIAVMVLLLGGLAVALFWLASNVSRDASRQQVTVPVVVNLPLDQAVSQLRAAGFTPDPHNEPNDKVPPGTVTDQDPKGNTQADRGAVVKLTVSGGVAQVEVPPVIGFTEAAARSRLESLGLAVVIQQKNDEEAAKGTVIDQSPAGGAVVDKGSTVTVVVSAGKATVAVPDVTGQSATTAINTLTQAGFKPNQRSEPSDTVAAGKVITTQPAPGAQVPPGSAITVVVSAGPVPTTAAPTTSTPPTSASTSTASSTTSTTKPPPSSTTSSAPSTSTSAPKNP